MSVRPDDDGSGLASFREAELGGVTGEIASGHVMRALEAFKVPKRVDADDDGDDDMYEVWWDNAGCHSVSIPSIFVA